VLLRNFFKLFSQWSWPNPVHLCKPETGEHYYRNNSYLTPIWTAEKSNDLFPIITPAFPCMNSTFNVQHITRDLLISELKRGEQITAKLEGKTGGPELMAQVLLELIEDPNFFSSYSHFFDVTITTTTENEMNDWYNFVESKIRGFFNDVHNTNKARGKDPNAPPFTLRPWPYGVYDPTPGVFERHFYIGVVFHIPPSELSKMDFPGPFQRFLDTTTRLKLKTANMKVTIKHIRSKDLPDWVFPGGVRPVIEKKPAGGVKRKDAPKADGGAVVNDAAATNPADQPSPSNDEPLQPTMVSDQKAPNTGDSDTPTSSTVSTVTEGTAEGRVVDKTMNPSANTAEAQELVQLGQDSSSFAELPALIPQESPFNTVNQDSHE
jgi:poly(A) polymerase